MKYRKYINFKENRREVLEMPSCTDTKPVEALGYGVDFKCGVRMILFPKSQVRATPALVISVLDDDGIWQDWPIAVRSKGFSEFWKKAVEKLLGLEPDFEVTGNTFENP